jgi:hypothetical protein
MPVSSVWGSNRMLLTLMYSFAGLLNPHPAQAGSTTCRAVTSRG